MALVLKICGSEWENASRDKRELSVYQELGNEVAVLAKGNIKDKGRVDYVDGFKVYRYTTRPLGNRVPKSINRFFSIFQWAIFARSLCPDVISGHDLMPGLTIAWMTTVLSKKKIELIYDSHEFELGRNVKRGKLTKLFLKKWEKMMMEKCAFSIMVNDSIAEEVQKIHNLSTKPVVLRSTPNYCLIDEKKCQETRDYLLEKFKTHSLHKDSSAEADHLNCFLVLYHGVLTSGRGIETLMRLTAINRNIKSVIIGNGTESYTKKLNELSTDLGIEDRLLFHPAVSAKDLWKYVGAVDLSFMMIEDSAKSYYYALPNKLFESIQALTPIVASHFPEMKRIIQQYNIGLVCDPNDLDDINNAVETMRTDNNQYYKYKKKLVIAKEELCWENEKVVLKNAFARNICIGNQTKMDRHIYR